MRGAPASGGERSDGDEEGDGKNKEERGEGKKSMHGLFVDRKSRDLTGGIQALEVVLVSVSGKVHHN